MITDKNGVKKHDRTFLPPEKIADIYMLAAKGKTNREIELSMNLRQGRVYGLLHALAHYYPRLKNDRKLRYKHLVAASYVIAQRIQAKKEASSIEYNIAPTGVVTPVEQTDSFQKLAAAKETFENAISEFIEEQVLEQVKGVHEENTQLKADMAKMEEAFKVAKNSNWVDSLKNKFGKKEQPVIQEVVSA